MPLYILCLWCKAIPVLRDGDLCEVCQKVKDREDAQNKKRLERLEKKPRRVSEVMR